MERNYPTLDSEFQVGPICCHRARILWNVFHKHMNNPTYSFRTVIAGLLTVHMSALVPDASAVTPEEQVKMLMERHNAVLKQTLLGGLVLYNKKEGSKPETNKYAWFSEAGELRKVAIERKGDAGQERKEYFPYEPDGDPKRMMTVAVTRRESLLPDGAWRVEEESVYLARNRSGGLVILQKLTKTKDFKGRLIEMEDVPNVVHAPEPQEAEVSGDEASKREREFVEEPKKIALALQAAGSPARDPAAERKEAAAAREKEEEEQRSISPDGKWEFRLTEAKEGGSGYGDFVIAKRGIQETSVALSEEASGAFAKYARVVWAPDSKRFAFNYRPGFRVKAVQFFQLYGDDWRELDSPDSDEAISAPIERSMAAQRKKLKLSPKVSGRPISDGCEVRRWIDPSTALLHAFSQETFEIKNDLEPVGDAGLVTLIFNAAGDWKVARIRLLESTAAPELNKVEQDELAKMEKESD